MTIDWFTYVAQIINFLLLVWLLKRFLYGPIVNAMDAREQQIATRIQAATTAQEEARQQSREYRQQIDELQHTREELLAAAGRDVDLWKQEHIQQARHEVDQARTEWLKSLGREREAFLQELRRRAGRQVHTMAGHVLTKLCDAPLELRVIDAFATRLQQVEDTRRAAIADSIRNSHHRVLVETAFDLTDAGQEQIRNLIHNHLTDGVEIDFRTVPELICGIELKAAGYKVAWSVGESLQTLEEDFAHALDEAVL
ncbi:F0F1 ATP synthase subunit B [bacterium]|nr:F0F1 ATP synthase subunit B [bacterium]